MRPIGKYMYYKIFIQRDLDMKQRIHGGYENPYRPHVWASRDIEAQYPFCVTGPY